MVPLALSEEFPVTEPVAHRSVLPQETLELLEIGGIEAHVERTEEAVEVYNSLARDRPIGGLFHSTC